MYKKSFFIILLGLGLTTILIGSKSVQGANNEILSSGTIFSIKGNGYILGNKRATVTMIEYSDIQCPFCRIQHQNQTLQKLIKKYPNNINMMFKHFPLEFHTNALTAAIYTQCVGNIAGTSKFYKYLDKIFSGSDLSESSFRIAASGLNIPSKNIYKCINNPYIKKLINNQVLEAKKLFDINGTPSTVLINTKNGKYIVIGGAYPLEYFENAYKELLK